MEINGSIRPYLYRVVRSHSLNYLSQYKWVLIQHYVTGNATAEEHRKMNQWMVRDPERRKLIHENWDLTPDEEFDTKAQEAWEKFQTHNANSIRTGYHRYRTDIEPRFNEEITVTDDMLLKVPYTGTFQYVEN